MPNDEGGGAEQKRHEGVSEPNIDSTLNFSGNERRGAGTVPQEGPVDGSVPPLALSIMIFQRYDISKPNISASKSAAPEGGDKIPGMAASKKGFLSRSGSYQEQCRLDCKQAGIDFGNFTLADINHCWLALTLHEGLPCAAYKDMKPSYPCWCSNKCEICQQIAANVPFPESGPSVNNWVWRINTAYIMGQERERGCFSPFWVAFAILVGGLLLDVLVSVSLGVSALPVNIIIGVLIVLGLGTSFRLALECCQEWGARRNLQLTEVTLNPGYHPTV
ncbi:hypothetical protein OPV22_002286 [Ensete ventricosum]|uniref:Uncharacterized protein n=1 Tax=Ensete ventricosum TaxID=4639 RepID=A0AAV8RXF3_ENSVE|nr:hypothetical protein OPV22_002286 [Ensete ventricosum]